MTPAEMREMAALSVQQAAWPTWGDAQRIAAAIRALPIPDTTAADDALEKAREALEGVVGCERYMRNGGATEGDLGDYELGLTEAINIAFSALAAIDAAKAKGGG